MSVFNVETVRLGLANLRLHKLRSLLTALGIIFGVAAVVCMLSISEGASADEMRMIRLLGTQNVIVNSVKPEQTTQVSEANTTLLEYGIQQRDVRVIDVRDGGALPAIGSQDRATTHPRGAVLTIRSARPRSTTGKCRN